MFGKSRARNPIILCLLKIDGLIKPFKVQSDLTFDHKNALYARLSLFTSDHDFDVLGVAAKGVGEVAGVGARVLLDDLADDQDCFDAIVGRQGLQGVPALIPSVQEVTTILQIH